MSTVHCPLSTVPARAPRSFFATDPVTLARRLLGQRLVRVLTDGTRLAGLITETEAYLGIEDRAAHSYGGRRTARNEPMYGPPGLAYVYFTYGMHHCFNVVCGREGEPVAVLIRAIHPAEGLHRMRTLRAASRNAPPAERIRDADLCSGPGKLCAALAIDRELSGADMVMAGPIFIERIRHRPRDGSEVVVTPRIGIAYAKEWAAAPLRFLRRPSTESSLSSPRARSFALVAGTRDIMS